jgi:LDH2 family malate/lactate/ureidoglycolate dehydrogenase
MYQSHQLVSFASQVLNKVEFQQTSHRLRDMIVDMKNTRLAEGVSEIFIPGEIEYRVRTERIEKGIPLDNETVSELMQLSQQYDVKFD